MDKYYLTKERVEELKKELEYLETEKRREIAEKLKQAKEYGDLSENSEYSEARDEQSKAESRIFELKDILKGAMIIKKDEKSLKVNVGSTVTFRKDGGVFKYTIVGSNEARPEDGKISNESPLGKNFLDKRAGDSVEVNTPGGKFVCQILRVD